VIQYLKIAPVVQSSAQHEYLRRLNIAAVILGLLTMVGMVFVACFQDHNIYTPNRGMSLVHNGAATILFTTQLAYTWIITRIEYTLHTELNVSRRVMLYKLAICSLNSLIYFVGGILMILHLRQIVYWGDVALFEYLISFASFSFWLSVYFDFEGLDFGLRLEHKAAESSGLFAQQSSSYGAMAVNPVHTDDHVAGSLA